MNRREGEEPVELFGIPFFSGSFAEAVELLLQHCKGDRGDPLVVVTPNVDHVVRLDRDPSFKRIYMESDLFFADGAPLVVASRLLGRPLRERITGADMMPRLLEGLARDRQRVAIVGGAPGEEEKIVEAISHKYPGIIVSCICPPMEFDPSTQECDSVIARIAESRPMGVFLCIGSPKQEILALKLRERRIGRVHLCCGAALDFLLGRVKRAPGWVQRIGFEWAWRLLSEPRRLWRRYLVEDMRFFTIVLSELTRR